MEEGEGWRGKLEEVSACLLCVWGQKISPRVFLASHASSIIGTGEWHSLTDGYRPHLPTSGYFWMIQYPVRIQPVLLIVPFNILLCWPSTPYRQQSCHPHRQADRHKSTPSRSFTAEMARSDGISSCKVPVLYFLSFGFGVLQTVRGSYLYCTLSLRLQAARRSNHPTFMRGGQDTNFIGIAFPNLSNQIVTYPEFRVWRRTITMIWWTS